MSNQPSKLQCHSLPGDFFLSAIGENRLAIESRQQEQIYYSIFDLASGNLLIEIIAKDITPWYSLVGVSGSHLLLQLFENRQNPDKVKHFSYDPVKNNLLDEFEQTNYQQSIVVAPAYFPVTSNDFALFRQLIGPEIVLGCEYQEVKNHLIISYYVQEQNTFQRHLMILTDGQEVYREIQDEKMKGIAPGSFFTFENRLIFARHKRELNIYEI